jgi:glutathione synthase/RimK-type ligase-like ATP-grasp enzyme
MQIMTGRSGEACCQITYHNYKTFIKIYGLEPRELDIKITMKKIGILFGRERSFPEAVVQRINEIAETDIIAEFVSIDKIFQAEPLDYAVIIDRISQDVPFYRSALKNAAITGTAVINNPFWWSADEKFFNNALAIKIGVPVPKTALIPSYEMPEDTSDQSFSNLAFPMSWDEIFEYTGFPAYMKPFDGGGWKEVYKLHDKEDFFDKHNQTRRTVMMLQEEIEFTEYFRCYCIGGKHVRIMQYEPRNPFHLRYQVDTPPSSEGLLQTIHDYVLKLNQYLGYDFNTVEFAVRDGIPYAIDFCNPAPDAEVTSVGQANFDWVVETTAQYAIERAKAQVDGQDNLTWGTYVKTSATGMPLVSQTAAKLPVKAKSAPKLPKEPLAASTAPSSAVKKASAKPKK